jgi:LytS/YehU family sensor histidine kinase
MMTAVVLGVLISISILSIEISSQFFSHWKKSLVEVEKYKTESLHAQLQNLKNQINPHFLFNNMSVLSSLVYKDQDKAVDFINQLSKVYRYLLDNRNSELVTLDQELVFIRSYTYLLQIRFDTNIHFEFDIEDSKRNLMLPPMALQILIENAIKHNEVSSEQPLTIAIIVTDHFLQVRNNLQLRVNKETSCKTGLQNIKDRYQYFTDTPVEVIQNTNAFIVKIPLLKAQ